MNWSFKGALTCLVYIWLKIPSYFASLPGTTSHTCFCLWWFHMLFLTPSILMCSAMGFFFFPRVVLGSACASGADCDAGDVVIYSLFSASAKLIWSSISHIAECVCACICLHCQLSTLGRKTRRVGFKTSPVLYTVKYNRMNASLFCDKRELIEMHLSNMFILWWVLIFSKAFLLSPGTEKNLSGMFQYV